MNSKLLVIDNYDSFTFNLIQMFRMFDLDIEVYRNDEKDIEQLSEINPDYLLISPGPKTPEHAGVSMQAISRFYPGTPILGVCLGMQCINEFFGGKTIRSALPVHGKTCEIIHNQESIFSRVPTPFRAARYHSLQVSPGPDSPLSICARSPDSTIMGIAHPEQHIYGIQFHPESFLTAYGHTILQNFLESNTE
ncbi:MAG: anthranilate synthase component II [Thermodesulfobacteriota bacterium]